jgi:WD40 repeat protein
MAGRRRANGALAISRRSKDKVCRAQSTPQVRSVAVDEAGSRAFVGTDSSLDVLELTSCATAFSIPHAEPIMAIAVSSTGAWLATGTSDTPLIRAFTLSRTGATERFSTPRQGAIRTMAFDAEEGYLAVGAEDRTTRLYSTRDGSEVGRTNFTNSPWSVAFSADGTTLRSLTGEDDLSKTTLAIAARTLNTGALLKEICRRNPTSALSPAVWNNFMPELKYRRTCDAVLPKLRP